MHRKFFGENINRGAFQPGSLDIQRVFWVVFVFLLFFPLSISAKPGVGKLEKVSLQLKWHHQFQFAGYYAAKELGFYSRAGFDVDIIEGGPKIKVQDVVSSGRADFGVLGSELLFLRSQGEKLVVLAPIIQHSIRAIFVRNDRNITSPHDLPGKSIMLNQNEIPEFAAMFLNEGINIKGISIINKDKTANAIFIEGRIDGLNGSIANQPYLFARENVPFTIIRPVSYGIDFYGDALFTTQNQVKKRPEFVKAFMKASFQGWKYAFDHPEETIDIIIGKYGTQKTRAHLLFEYTRLRELIHPDLVEIGHNNPERWQHIADTYIKLGLIGPGFSLKGLLYEDYVKPDYFWLKGLSILLGLLGITLIIFFSWNSQLRKIVHLKTKEIQENRENLEITLNSIGDAVIATDLSGNVVRMNPTAEKLTGWVFEEAKGQNLASVFHIINNQTREVAGNPVDKVLARGEIVGLANHTALIAKDGTEYQIADSGAPIKDSQGNTTGVVLVFQDMTREYHMQENIKQSEKKFRSYVENAPYGIFVADEKGYCLEVNESVFRITGYSAKELLNKKIVTLFPEQEHARMQQQFETAIKKGRSRGVVSFSKKDKGKNFWAVDAVKLSENRFLGFIDDITRRKLAEDELQKMQKLKSVGTLAGGIAHDFNNILMGLFGNISMAKEELSEDHPGFEFLGEAEKMMTRATRLTKQLLTFAKGGAPVREDTRLGELVKEIVQFDLSGSNVLPVFKEPKDLWMADVDKGQIQQVFSNLAINADQAMPDGGHLYVTMENVNIPDLDNSTYRGLNLMPGKYIRILVEDEGTGIEPKYLGRIYDPYFTTKQTGSGLGLATTYSVINKHGGLIIARSELGKGTCFTIYLPASEGVPFQEKMLSEEILEGAEQTARVLVMDDEAAIRDLVCQMLERCGYSVQTAKDGGQAIFMYQQAQEAGTPFEIVIMDLTIPGGMGGKEAIKDLLNLDPGIRAIVSSGYADDPVMTNPIEYGFMDRVEKPYTKSLLEEVVGRVFKG